MINLRLDPQTSRFTIEGLNEPQVTGDNNPTKVGVRFHTSKIRIALQNLLCKCFGFSEIVEFKGCQVNLKSFENFLRRFKVDESTIEAHKGNIAKLIEIVKEKSAGPQTPLNNNVTTATTSTLSGNSTTSTSTPVSVSTGTESTQTTVKASNVTSVPGGPDVSNATHSTVTTPVATPNQSSPANKDTQPAAPVSQPSPAPSAPANNGTQSVVQAAPTSAPANKDAQPAAPAAPTTAPVNKGAQQPAAPAAPTAAPVNKETKPAVPAASTSAPANKDAQPVVQGAPANKNAEPASSASVSAPIAKNEPVALPETDQTPDVAEEDHSNDVAMHKLNQLKALRQKLKRDYEKSSDNEKRTELSQALFNIEIEIRGLENPKTAEQQNQKGEELDQSLLKKEETFGLQKTSIKQPDNKLQGVEKDATVNFVMSELVIPKEPETEVATSNIAKPAAPKYAAPKKPNATPQPAATTEATQQPTAMPGEMDKQTQEAAVFAIILAAALAKSKENKPKENNEEEGQQDLSKLQVVVTPVEENAQNVGKSDAKADQPKVDELEVAKKETNATEQANSPTSETKPDDSTETKPGTFKHTYDDYFS